AVGPDRSCGPEVPARKGHLSMILDVARHHPCGTVRSWSCALALVVSTIAQTPVASAMMPTPHAVHAMPVTEAKAHTHGAMNINRPAPACTYSEITISGIASDQRAFTARMTPSTTMVHEATVVVCVQMGERAA